MPNPKVGTVTMDVAKAVQESKAGKVEYRTDRNAIVHLVIGKTSFDERELLENYAAVIEELIRAKPSAAKGRYLHTITLASTMGPGVKVDPTRTRDITGDAAARRPPSGYTLARGKRTARDPRHRPAHTCSAEKSGAGWSEQMHGSAALSRLPARAHRTLRERRT